jgi:anhydro-N-acetylmuramic acid kinase
MHHSHVLIGLSSGTSADGIDAVLVRMRGIDAETRVKQLAFATYPYPKGLKEFILKNSIPGSSSVDTICRLNALLAHVFADVAKKIAKRAGVPLTTVDVIGSHGQTVHHLPVAEVLFGKRVRSTLQLGDPSMIAALTGVPTIGNFRPADMALGGQGAPLVPILDHILFRSKTKSRLLVNLGGIANITILPASGTLNDVQAFDTGPANMVIDALMNRLFGRMYDKGGAVARSGMIAHDLLEWMMRHPYLRRTPPKSTGREEFGATFVKRLLVKAKGYVPEDIIATATEFTALAVYEQYVHHGRSRGCVDEVFVSGGGTHNRAIMDALQRHFCSVPVRPVDTLGFSSDAKEAILFAVLAHQTMHGAPGNVPNATGASRHAVLGMIAQG